MNSDLSGPNTDSAKDVAPGMRRLQDQVETSRDYRQPAVAPSTIRLIRRATTPGVAWGKTHSGNPIQGAYYYSQWPSSPQPTGYILRHQIDSGSASPSLVDPNGVVTARNDQSTTLGVLSPPGDFHPGLNQQRREYVISRDQPLQQDSRPAAQPLYGQPVLLPVSHHFTPPLPYLPNHLRRGRKSFPASKGASMLQECFSTDNTPYTTSGPDRVPAEVVADLEPVDNSEDEIEIESIYKGLEEVIILRDDELFDSPSRSSRSNPLTGSRSSGGVPMSISWLLNRSSNPRDAERAVEELLDLTETGKIDSGWLKEIRTSVDFGYFPDLLSELLRVADLVTPVDSVLSSKSPCGKILDFMGYENADNLLSAVLHSHNGTTGLRYIICRARSKGVYRRHVRGNSLDTIPAIRLVESILPNVRNLSQLQQPIYRNFLNVVIRILKRKDHVRQGESPNIDTARRIAALHLVSSTSRTYKSLIDRLDAESDSPVMPKDEWILEELGVGDITPYLYDDTDPPLLRCMALRMLRDLADGDVEGVAHWKPLEEILVIAVDVLLWRTKWQHGHEAIAKSLGIAKFCPQDDAYQILTSSRPELVMRAKDVKTVPSNIDSTLIRLVSDESLPISLRDRASDAVAALRENFTSPFGTSLPLIHSTNTQPIPSRSACLLRSTNHPEDVLANQVPPTTLRDSSPESTAFSTTATSITSNLISDARAGSGRSSLPGNIDMDAADISISNPAVKETASEGHRSPPTVSSITERLTSSGGTGGFLGDDATLVTEVERSEVLANSARSIG
ncbi:hypothetical protein FRB90_004870 [Tulasnella sp. 427]|nr:hypothetical protein FRB90_004870 [Tulasnella sp. 427]